MSPLRQRRASRLEIGEPERIGRGPLRGRSATICIETAVATPVGGACVLGWVADPSGRLESVRVDTAAGEVDLPLGEFSAFVDGPESEGSAVELNVKVGRGGPRRLEAPVGTGLRSTFEAARRVGLRGLAPHLPESSSDLPEAWREALLGLLWLLPDGSADAPALEAYLMRGEPLALPGWTGAAGARRRSSGPDPHAEEAAEVIGGTGLFDAEWYRERYPDVIDAEADPLFHYCEFGWIEDRDPSAAFSTSAYLQVNPDVAASAMNPLWHFAAFGKEEGRPVFPADGGGGAPMAPTALPTDPRVAESIAELFDRDFYIDANPDVRASGADPLTHYLEVGHLEGRDPSLDFHTDYYRAKYLGRVPELNPLVHYVQVGAMHGHETRPGSHDLESDLAAQVRFRVNPGPEFEELDESIGADLEPRAKAMAFYLPQFHTVPENDEWWGKGFTEWRNVARGLPRFAGHYQPRIPRDLGFYDLSEPGVLREQVRLARLAGLHAFCFHYYWFNGRRLLERPLDAFMADPSLDLSFSVAWANENWTRRWDGLESDVLLRQEYDPADDEALVDDLQRYFDDPRYLRLEGRPLLTVYRADIVPDPRRTFERWRRIWKDRHSEEPLIFLAQTFGLTDPREAGLDGAVEFPPHKLTENRNTQNHRYRVLDPAFRGQIFDYSEVAAAAVSEPWPAFPLVKTAVPSWDNDGRRQGKGLVLQGSSPSRYEAWLSRLVESAREHPVYGESLVAVNAWNEWAEAAYLEPDVHDGAALLNATARAIYGVRKEGAKEGVSTDAAGDGTTPSSPAQAQVREKRKILLVGHDAHPFGSQHLLRHIGDTLANQFGCEVAYLLRSDAGEMTDHYSEIGDVSVTGDDPTRTDALLSELYARGFRTALTNTTATGSVVPHLKHASFRVVSLIHELPRIVEEYGLREPLERLAESSDRIVFPAESVRDAFCEGIAIDPGKLVVRPQGLYHRVEPAEGDRDRLRAELGVGPDARLVMNAGSGDLRKGVDIFIHAAKMAPADMHFVWVGKLTDDASRWLTADLDDDLSRRLHLVPYTPDIDPYFAAADAFFLSSREDPYPAVVLEAMHAGLPVVALEGSGGIEELVREHGRVVNRNRYDEILSALGELSEHREEGAGERQRVADEEYRWDEYCFELVQLLHPGTRSVSVVVPNYNYADHLEGRLESVFGQTHPILELIVLDDHSSDDSLERLAEIESKSGRHLTVVPREENSGSVYRAWQSAAELARGELLWIAEADDLARPELLDALVAMHAEPGVAIAFSDSAQIDEEGRAAGDSYKEYFRTAAGDALERDVVMAGEEFARVCLAERNLILNVSAVVWNREALAGALESSLAELLLYKLAGDWYLYLLVALGGGRVAYSAEALNVHRRHGSSVTGALAKEAHLAEVERVHAFLASRINLDAAAKERMTAYVAELRKQFGLDEGPEA